MITPVNLTPLAELYLIKEAIEPALASLITAAAGVTVYHELDREIKTGLPWVEVDLDPGSDMGQMAPCGAGGSRNVAFKGTLNITIYSDRGAIPDETASDGDKAAAQAVRDTLAAQHRIIRAQILNAIPRQNVFTQDEVPNHQVTFAIIRSQRSGVDDSDRDLTELTYDTVCGIRPGAMRLATS